MTTLARSSIALLLAATTALAPAVSIAAEAAPPPPPPRAPGPPPPSGAVSKPTSRPRLAVVDLGCPPTMLGMSGKITKLIADEAPKEGTYEVIDSTAVRLGIGDEGVKNLQACIGKAECIGAIAEPLGVARLVTGLLDRTADSYIVKLWLVDVAGRSVVSSVDRKILIASRRLERDVAEAIPALLKGEKEAVGKARIAVQAEIEGAELTIDGEPAGIAPLVFTGKPGKHTLKLARQGYYPVERFFTVDAGGDSRVEVTLVPIPGAKPAAVAKKGEPQKVEEAGGIQLPLGSWIAGGLAVAAAGGAIAFGAMASGTESDGAEGADGVRQITRVEAQGGESDAFTANILFGVAGAALAAGVAIAIFTGEGSAPAQAQLAPSASGVSVSGTF